MLQQAKSHSQLRIHAYAASFGEDLASELISEHTTEGTVVLDPFVGAGTTALQSVLSNRSAIGIDVDPIACRISRILTSRFDVPHLLKASENLSKTLLPFSEQLAKEPSTYSALVPGATFKVLGKVFVVPTEPRIAYWFDPSHMATLSIIRSFILAEHDSLIQEAFEVALSSSIVRKWPNTISLAMDIDHSRPHRPKNISPQPIAVQFALFERILNQVKDSVLRVQPVLTKVNATAEIIEGDAYVKLKSLDSESVGFVLTSPPYLNAIDYHRAHKFSQWWLSPGQSPVPRTDYLGLRNQPNPDPQQITLRASAILDRFIEPFEGSSSLGRIRRYVLDLAAVVEQIHRILRPGGTTCLLIANNVIGGTVFPVSSLLSNLLESSGFSKVSTIQRTIKHTRRRYPFGINGFVGPMKDEFLVRGTK